jgi:hypothetical protein
VTIASPPRKKSAPPAGSADKAKRRFGQQIHTSGRSIQPPASKPSYPGPAIMTLPERSDASGASPPEPLAKEIKRAGMMYREFWRQGTVAIYCAKGGGPRIEYEVFQVQLFPTEEFDGRRYPAREGLPKNSEWGELGFTYTNNSHRNPASAALAKAQGLLYWKGTALPGPLKGALAA